MNIERQVSVAFCLVDPSFAVTRRSAVALVTMSGPALQVPATATDHASRSLCPAPAARLPPLIASDPFMSISIRSTCAASFAWILISPESVLDQLCPIEPPSPPAK